MANFNVSSTGKIVDNMTKTLTNLGPKINVVGVDANSTVTYISPASVTATKTADSSGNCTVDLPVTNNVYGIWSVTGVVSGTSTTELITVDVIKEYTVDFNS